MRKIHFWPAQKFRQNSERLKKSHHHNHLNSTADESTRLAHFTAQLLNIRTLSKF